MNASNLLKIKSKSKHLKKHVNNLLLINRELTIDELILLSKKYEEFNCNNQTKLIINKLSDSNLYKFAKHIKCIKYTNNQNYHHFEEYVYEIEFNNKIIKITSQFSNDENNNSYLLIECDSKKIILNNQEINIDDEDEFILDFSDHDLKKLKKMFGASNDSRELLKFIRLFLLKLENQLF
jgi:hypothetical protein